ncbi:MAG TPA: GrpB family protein [Candidatus Limnocylindrales bacterium]|nr:GrpB family protein [Candidatus Limnocylindrales bacterium]
MSELDPTLAERLRTVGLDPHAFGDPEGAWRRLHDCFGARITLVDRYSLEAAHRGTYPDKLDDELRARLRAETLRAQFPSMEFTAGSERADGAVEVVPYDSRWPARFEAWRHRLAAALGSAATRIEHVGSTAVPGLAAKPIVDIQVSVGDPEVEADYVPAVENTGLQLRAREPDHRYFRPPPDRPRELHVHVCAAGSTWERDHLLFRNYLRAHPATRDAYADLKRTLVQRYPDDRLAYTDAKSAFILDTLDAASAWDGR